MIGVTISTPHGDLATRTACAFMERFQIPFHIFLIEEGQDICQAKLELHRHFLINQTVVFAAPGRAVPDIKDLREYDHRNGIVGFRDEDPDAEFEARAYGIDHQGYLDTDFYVFNPRHFRIFNKALKAYKSNHRAIGSLDLTERPILNWAIQTAWFPLKSGVELIA